MNGYQVVEASGGDEAVRVAESMCPNLILMDTGLPKIDGLTATQQIRKLKGLRDVNIIFLSGYTQPQARDVALAAGANDYLVKPIDFDELNIALKSTYCRCSVSQGITVTLQRRKPARHRHKHLSLLIANVP